MADRIRLAPRVRHVMARHRWWYRGAVAVGVLAVWWSLAAWAHRVEAERSRWGDTVEVWVATHDLHPGSTLAGSVVRQVVPVALAPPAALDPALGPHLDLASTTIRHPVAAAAIVTRLDVAADRAPQSLLDAGQVAVAVVERVPSGARSGDRVAVATEGVVVAAEARVVAVYDDRTVLGVDTAAGPLVAAAALGPGGVSLLLLP